MHEHLIRDSLNTRKAAKAVGEKSYFTGLPCSRGHISPRNTISAECLECHHLRRTVGLAPREKFKTPRWKRTFLKNPDAYRRKHAAQRKRQYWADPEKARAKGRKAQGVPEPTRPCPALCECCGSPPIDRALCADHNHKTGKFRGWICRLCNIGIGNFKDNPDTCAKAAEYLRRAS
jgi:Recombination endonuclease VII